MDLIIPIVTMAFHHSPSGEIKKNEVNNVVKAVTEQVEIILKNLLI